MALSMCILDGEDLTLAIPDSGRSHAASKIAVVSACVTCWLRSRAGPCNMARGDGRTRHRQLVRSLNADLKVFLTVSPEVAAIAGITSTSRRAMALGRARTPR